MQPEREEVQADMDDSKPKAVKDIQAEEDRDEIFQDFMDEYEKKAIEVMAEPQAEVKHSIPEAVKEVEAMKKARLDAMTTFRQHMRFEAIF